ncbi:hypothetical protein Plhal703r1_c80g0173631 [Plasmopara halstedii]
MGFSCATERPCLAYMKTLAAPGPGTYKCETPRSLNQTVKLKLGIGRNGVFGTTSERKIWGEEACTPGPGAYSEFGSFDTKHYLNSAAFKSASVRFYKECIASCPPHIHCVGDHVSPAVGQYNVSTNLFNVTLNRPDKWMLRVFRPHAHRFYQRKGVPFMRPNMPPIRQVLGRT